MGMAHVNTTVRQENAVLQTHGLQNPLSLLKFCCKFSTNTKRITHCNMLQLEENHFLPNFAFATVSHTI